jgi:hypothetical protein
MPKSTKRRQTAVNFVQQKCQQVAHSPQSYNDKSRLRRGDRLCARCRSLNFDVLFEPRRNTKPNPQHLGATIYPLGVVHKSMLGSQCPLCRLFAAIYPGRSNSTEQMCVLKKFSAVQHHFRNSYRKKSIRDTVILSISPMGTELWRPNHERKKGIIYLADENQPSRHQSILGNVINSRRINYLMVKDWIHYCRAHHKGYCNHESSTELHSVAGFKTIDCETRQVVKPSEKVEYVALSYLWGSGSYASTRSVPNPASRVIEDAMVVTKELGFRYLWVDRYCISQIDSSERHHQIQRMDQIYAGAVLTIVAAAGEGPQYGLPGVSQTPRHTQPRALVGNYHLVSSLRSPRDVVLSSKWASRGWTFQEAMLSRRTLFFTDDQLLYECASMTCQETVQMPLAAAHQEWSNSMGHECDKTRIFAHNGPGRFSIDVLERITEYTSRTLTWPTDNLNAFLGVLNRFKTRQTSVGNPSKALSVRNTKSSVSAAVYHLWGLPLLPHAVHPYCSSIDIFSLMLLWRCLSPSVRSSSLPSWSWSGWTLPSKVEFCSSSEGGKIILHSGSMVNVWLRLGPNKMIPFSELEEQPRYQKILEEASQTLILEGFMVEINFRLTQDKKTPLIPTIVGYHSNATLCFRPNIKLDTEQKLKRFTERNWEAIFIFDSTICGKYGSMLVLEKAGTAYERIGVLDIEHVHWDFFWRTKLTLRTIELR